MLLDDGAHGQKVTHMGIIVLLPGLGLEQVGRHP